MRFEHSFCLLLISGTEFKLKGTVCLCLSILTLFFKQENIDLGKHKFMCTFFLFVFLKVVKKNCHLADKSRYSLHSFSFVFFFFVSFFFSAQSTSL